jgi:polyisoprenoid-binding protein YceI
MKRIFGSIFAVLLVLSAIASSPASYSAKSHEIKISGTSNLHDWTADVPRLTTSAEILINDGRIEAINRLVIEIDATAITGSEGNIMTRKIAETLKSDRNPRIVFRMTRIDNISQTGREFSVRAGGTLAMGGTTRPLELVVRGRVLPNGDVQFTGVKDMKMTTWQLEPPRAMLGALRTGDDVTVEFSVTLKN